MYCKTFTSSQGADPESTQIWFIDINFGGKQTKKLKK